MSQENVEIVRRGIETLWNEFFFTFEEAQIETTHGFTDAGSEVVVSNTSHFRGREGIEVSASSTWVFTVENGQITCLRLFHERAEGPRSRRAAGVGDAREIFRSFVHSDPFGGQAAREAPADQPTPLATAWQRDGCGTDPD